MPRGAAALLNPFSDMPRPTWFGNLKRRTFSASRNHRELWQPQADMKIAVAEFLSRYNFYWCGHCEVCRFMVVPCGRRRELVGSDRLDLRDFDAKAESVI